MKRSTAKLLSVICMILAIVLVVIFIFSGNQIGELLVLLVYTPICLILLYFQRCPHCGAMPRKGSFFDEYCPHCGNNLNDWD